MLTNGRIYSYPVEFLIDLPKREREKPGLRVLYERPWVYNRYVTYQRNAYAYSFKMDSERITTEDDVSEYEEHKAESKEQENFLPEEYGIEVKKELEEKEQDAA
ncbi:hypothetical protein MRB53_007783 [Persea americana]|uniref:Uncharacterized protein n=1 Tax=Persea americana TaxID=3435 RepID=A0ACC2MK83_PERAE|nr:hypothetical protein MRB53_007783 [Persea americana]